MVRNAEDAAAKAAEQSAPVKQLPKVVANTTDPQSRSMPTRRGFVQGYNAQAPCGYQRPGDRCGQAG